MITPTMRKLLRAVNAGAVVRKCGTRFYGRTMRYVFGWTGPVGERTIDAAQRQGLVEFVPPTEKCDNPFVAAGGVGGKLILTQAGRDALGDLPFKTAPPQPS